MAIRKSAVSTSAKKSVQTVIPEGPAVPEEGVAEVGVVGLAEAVVAVAPAEKPATVEEVTVMALFSDHFEPFQRIALPQGVAVTLKNTSWVASQVEANVLKRV